MAEFDVRGVLQYVPQFRGQVFVVLFEDGLLPEAAVAESLLDILALQKIGVKLVLATLGGDIEALTDWAIEMELKAGRTLDGLDVERASEILMRGQAVIVDAGRVRPLAPEVVAFAAGVGATKLIALCDGDVITRDGQPLISVARGELVELAEQENVEGREMLMAAGEACAAGIDRVHLLNGKRHGVLVDELFSNEGVGTMVHRDSYREVRALREEDIPELLAMIGRTVRASWLVPRNYEEIRNKMDDYSVLTVDGNVVGCVAVHSYDSGSRAELACLYVKRTHESTGYGGELVRHALERARQRGVKRVFALTTKAANFFRDHLGWQEVAAETLPEQRYDQWAQSQRGSLVFECRL